MALTRKSLRAMGIEDEKIEQIVEANGESIAGLKDEIDRYKLELEKYQGIEKELEKLKTEAAKDNPFEKKYNDIKAEFDKYKADVEAKETKTAKETAVKAYLESKNIKGNNLKLAMKAAKDEIASVEIADGKIKDTSALDTLIQGDFSGLVSKEITIGATVATPPQNTGGETKSESRAAKLAAQYHANLYGENSKGE